LLQPSLSGRQAALPTSKNLQIGINVK
jgi:hypothetical protein